MLFLAFFYFLSSFQFIDDWEFDQFCFVVMYIFGVLHLWNWGEIKRLQWATLVSCILSTGTALNSYIEAWIYICHHHHDTYFSSAGSYTPVTPNVSFSHCTLQFPLRPQHGSQPMLSCYSQVWPLGTLLFRIARWGRGKWGRGQETQRLSDEPDHSHSQLVKYWHFVTLLCASCRTPDSQLTDVNKVATSRAGKCIQLWSVKKLQFLNGLLRQAPFP